VTLKLCLRKSPMNEIQSVIALIGQLLEYFHSRTNASAAEFLINYPKVNSVELEAASIAYRACTARPTTTATGSVADVPRSINLREAHGRATIRDEYHRVLISAA
jgi:hypothetical protein